MRKIEQQMLRAINTKSNWSLTNTTVKRIDDVNMAVYLHGNHIADVNSRSGFVMVNKDTLRCWPSNTTKSRLRALGANLMTKKGVIYLDGNAI